jgi:hypothetical protein
MNYTSTDGWTLQDSASSPYTSICKLAAQNDEYFATFKSNPAYRHVLEHVSFEEGVQYLNEIKIEYLDKLEEIKENDLYGSPVRYDYNNIGEISPTTIRYIKNTSDIITKFGNNFNSIVEIGGGYGGLCKVMKSFVDFDSYLLIDLEECNLLSRKYVSKFNLPAHAYRSEEVEVQEDFDIFISNYALSECTREIQLGYIEKFLKKSKKFYIMHNNFHAEDGGMSHVDFIDIVSNDFEVECLSEHDNELGPKIIFGERK